MLVWLNRLKLKLSHFLLITDGSRVKKPTMSLMRDLKMLELLLISLPYSKAKSIQVACLELRVWPQCLALLRNLNREMQMQSEHQISDRAWVCWIRPLGPHYMRLCGYVIRSLNKSRSKHIQNGSSSLPTVTRQDLAAILKWHCREPKILNLWTSISNCSPCHCSLKCVQCLMSESFMQI